MIEQKNHRSTADIKEESIHTGFSEIPLTFKALRESEMTKLREEN